MPFTLYLDDSGTSPSQHVAIATALIIPARQIIRMESEWATLKAKEGFSDFHTSEFVARNPKSDFAGWDDAKHKHVFARVRQITKKYVSQVISLAVNKVDYEQIMPAEFRKFLGEHHYSWALRHVVNFAQLWRLNYAATDPYEWIFDWMERKDPARREVETVLEQAEEMAVLERNVHGDYTNYSFRYRKTLAGLQCADLVAWTNYQFALEKFKGTPVPPFAKIAWDDFASMSSRSVPSINKKMEWNFSVTIKRDHLQDWVKRELSDGRSLVRFREFEEKKKALKANGVKTNAARTK